MQHGAACLHERYQVCEPLSSGGHAQPSGLKWNRIRTYRYREAAQKTCSTSSTTAVLLIMVATGITMMREPRAGPYIAVRTRPHVVSQQSGLLLLIDVVCTTTYCITWHPDINSTAVQQAVRGT